MGFFKRKKGSAAGVVAEGDVSNIPYVAVQRDAEEDGLSVSKDDASAQGTRRMANENLADRGAREPQNSSRLKLRLRKSLSMLVKSAHKPVSPTIPSEVTFLSVSLIAGCPGTPPVIALSANISRLFHRSWFSEVLQRRSRPTRATAASSLPVTLFYNTKRCTFCPSQL
jgi:hypothetical protein